MKLVFLLVQKNGSLKEVETFLKGEAGAVAVRIESIDRLERALETVVPHVVLVDLDPIAELTRDEVLKRIESLKNSGFEKTPFILFSSSVDGAFILGAMESRVADVILQPYHWGVLKARLSALIQRLTHASAYDVYWTESPPALQVETSAGIQAISESGILLETPLRKSSDPMTQIKLECHEFKELSLELPALMLAHTGAKSGFVQVQGWNERDRKKVIHFIRKNKLECDR